MRINGLANGGLYLRIERYIPSFSLFLSLLSSVAFTGGQLHTSVLRKRGTQIKVFEVLWDFHLGRGGRRVCLCLSVCGCDVHLCWPLVGSLFTFAVLLPLLQGAGLLFEVAGREETCPLLPPPSGRQCLEKRHLLNSSSTVHRLQGLLLKTDFFLFRLHSVASFFVSVFPSFLFVSFFVCFSPLFLSLTCSFSLSRENGQLFHSGQLLCFGSFARWSMVAALFGRAL